MKAHKLFHVVLLCPLLAASASNRNSPVAPGDGFSGGGGSTIGLIRSLEQQGVSVTPMGEMPRASFPFFAVTAQRLLVAGGNVHVFEYSTEEAVLAERAKVSPAGTPIGLTQVDWIDTPRFYHQGRILVLYVGRSDPVVRALDNALGPPFAGLTR